MPAHALSRPSRKDRRSRCQEREQRLKQLLTERYRDRLAGVVSCYDRIIVTGTLSGVCHARGMTASELLSQPRQFAVSIAVRSWWLCGLRKGRTR